MKILLRLKINFLYNKGKLLFFSFITFLLFFSLLFVGAEFFFALFSDKGKNWSPDAVQKDREINNSHFICAEVNEFGFNDTNYPLRKKEGYFRIIVMGDSFIWGDGLEKKDIWSRKLETKLRQEYKVEVLHWGICGWSTQDQYNFLKDKFSQQQDIYDADLIIFGVLDNDLITSDEYKLKKIFISDYLSMPWLKRRFPYMINKIDTFLYNFFSTFPFSDIGHTAYIKKLVSAKNLQIYGQTIGAIKQFLDSKKVRFFFVNTPYAGKKYISLGDAIEDTMKKQGVYCLNFTKALVEKFKNVNYKKLYASPVNYHPGPLLTEQYALFTYRELVQNGWLDKAERLKE